MNHTHRTAGRRLALVVSSVAVTITMCLGGMPHAAADPYDGDDTSEVIASDPGAYEALQQDSGAAGTAGFDSAPEPAADEPTVDEAPAPVADGPEMPDAGADPVIEDQDAAADAPQEPAAPASAPDATDDRAPATAPAAEPDAGGDATQADDQDAPAPEADVAAVPQSDVELAQATAPVDVTPQPATPTQVQELTQALAAYTSTSSTSSSSWSSTVTQWNSSWVGYDTYYRPVFTNPYRDTLTLVYTYDNVVQVVDVAPLQRGVLAVPTPGVYVFTAVTRAESGQIATVSTGSFSGGGYVPAAGQQPPRKPTEPTTYQNVLVALRYTATASQPFRVKTLTDLGDDPAAGARRVLLDSETPVWGRWSTAPNGERLFEVTKSQQLPGLTAPAQGALPGYDVRMTGAETRSADSWVTPAAIGAATCGVLAVAGVGCALAAGRRRRAE